MAAGARRMRLPERLESPAVGFAVACLLAAAAVCSLVGTIVLFHPGGSAVGRNPSSDYQIMTWSLAWWPWAVRHAVNPLHTHLLWAPGGFSTLWMTTIPAASLIALPRQAQEDRLKDVFRVLRVARDPVGGPENHGMVFAEDPFQIRRRQVSRFHGGSH